MHAVYSVSAAPSKTGNRTRRRRENSKNPSDTKVFHHIIERSASLSKAAKLIESAMLTGKRPVDSVHGHHLARRDQDEVEDIGLNGKGTNMRMIRLIYNSESFEPRADDTSVPPMKSSDTDLSEQELLNPLVIGIAVVCVILVIALVVVGVMYRRKGSRGQQQNPEFIFVLSLSLLIILH